MFHLMILSITEGPIKVNSGGYDSFQLKTSRRLCEFSLAQKGLTQLSQNGPLFFTAVAMPG